MKDSIDNHARGYESVTPEDRVIIENNIQHFQNIKDSVINSIDNHTRGYESVTPEDRVIIENNIQHFQNIKDTRRKFQNVNIPDLEADKHDKDDEDLAKQQPEGLDDLINNEKQETIVEDSLSNFWWKIRSTIFQRKKQNKKA